MSDRITLPLYQVGWSSEAPLADKGTGHLLSCKNYVIKQNLLESRKGYFTVDFVDTQDAPLTFTDPVKTLIPLPEYNMLIVASDDTIYIFEKIAGIYWCVVTAIFLAWSFFGNAWGVSWVIWPVAGVLFGAIACAVRVMGKR